MNKLFVLISLGIALTAHSASAAGRSIDLAITCMLISVTEDGTPIGSLTHFEEHRVAFSASTTARDSMGTLIEFGSGKIFLRQSMRAIQADGTIDLVPIEIDFEVIGPSEDGFKNLSGFLRTVNPFTGQTDSMRLNYSRPFSDSFHYVRHDIVRQSAPSHLPIGALLGRQVFCRFEQQR